MSLRMPGPWKHPTTGVYYLRQRMPADLKGAPPQGPVMIPVGDAQKAVNVGPWVKVSLATKDPTQAKTRHREADAALQEFWRLYRHGPKPLTQKEVQALAGLLYADLVARMDAEPGPESIWAQVIELNNRKKEYGELDAWFGGSVDQLLTKQGVHTDAASRARVIGATFTAIQLAAEANLRKAQGDYSTDDAAKRFPSWSSAGKGRAAPKGDAGQFDLFALLDHKFSTQSLKAKTKDDYRRDLEKFAALIGHSDARRVTKDDVRNWRDQLIGEGLAPKKINGKALAALSGVLTHAVNEFSLSENVVHGVRDARKGNGVVGPKGYDLEQAQTILNATFRGSPKGLSAPHARALFWVPWICAYTGLRVSEITQLRGMNVRQDGDTPYLLITPADGSTKSGKAWITGIHRHLIDLGLLDMFRAVGDGPAFYVPYPPGADLQSITGKHRAKDSGDRVGAWITQELGIPAPGGKPNHAWRHLFTTLSRVHEMEPQARNFMLGSGPIDAREGYGEWPPSVVAREVARLPRFQVKETTWRPSYEVVQPQPIRAPRAKRD